MSNSEKAACLLLCGTDLSPVTVGALGTKFFSKEVRSSCQTGLHRTWLAKSGFGLLFPDFQMRI